MQRLEVEMGNATTSLVKKCEEIADLESYKVHLNNLVEAGILDKDGQPTALKLSSAGKQLSDGKMFLTNGNQNMMEATELSTHQ